MGADRPKLPYQVFLHEQEDPDVVHLPGENFHRHYASKERRSDSQPVLVVHPLGNTWAPIEFLAKALGLLTLTALRREVEGDDTLVRPLPITNLTKSLGAALSPETICYPFKPILGSFCENARVFEESKQKTGKDVYALFITHESTGSCRERLYGREEALLLKEFYQREFGHSNFDFYVARESLGGIWELVTLLSRLSGRDRRAVVGLLNEAIRRLDLLETFQKEVRYAQSLMGAAFGPADQLLEEARVGAVVDDRFDLEPYRTRLQQLQAENQVRDEPLGRLIIAGEIFLCEEVERSSGDIEREAARRGFFVVKEGIGEYTPRIKLTLGRFARFLVNRVNPFKVDQRRELARAGGLSRDAGGHSIGTVALVQGSEETKERGEGPYDGVIILLPFNCLPQIMAGNILKNSSKIPLLSLSFDEQTGEAGVLTRLEAFLDLITRRKATEQKQHRKLGA